MMKAFMVLSTSILVALFSGCSGYTEADSFEKNLEKKMKESEDPNFAVKTIRKFALEKLDDLNSEEEKVITSTLPKISSNYDNSEYSFVWKLKEHYEVEVVTTGPPFLPIGVYRVKRTFYP